MPLSTFAGSVATGAGTAAANGLYLQVPGAYYYYNNYPQYTNGSCFLSYIYGSFLPAILSTGVNGTGTVLYFVSGGVWTGVAPVPTFTLLSCGASGTLDAPFAVMLSSGGAAISVILSWTTTNATSASIAGIGGLTTNPNGTTSGTVTVSVTADTPYTLTVTDASGRSAYCTWIVYGHAYRPSPCITGDPVITVCGKALEGR